MNLPSISLQIGGAEHASTSVQIVALLTLLSLAPAILVTLTAFVRIVIVLSFLRQAVGTQDLVVRLDVDVVLDAREDGRLSLCFPNAALDPVRARLRRVQANGDESGAAEPSWAERLRAALADAECEVSAELGSHLMSLRDVLALKTGDLIPLRTGREGPIVVRVAGRARFLGAPGVAGGSNAVRVTGRI